MKILKQTPSVRLVDFGGRYEVQEMYGYYAKPEDEEQTFSWHMSCWSSDLCMAEMMYSDYIK